MNIFIIGNPGSGKGTQADLISERLGFVHFSTGEVFRNMNGSDLDMVNKYMSKGQLVPDDFVIKTVEKYMTEHDLFDNMIIDGSPRSLYQYTKFKDFFKQNNSKFDLAFYIKISDDEVIRRLSSRREDSKTGKIYNLITNPPGPEVDSINLIQRKDDTPEAVSERLRVQKVPENLLNAFRDDGILVEIDGERPVEDIFNDIKTKIEAFRRGVNENKN